MPIITLQRRMTEVGRLRMGQKGDRGQPEKLATWRLTSRDQARLEAAAALYGGTVQPWEAREGEYEVIVEVDELPIIILPGQTLSQFFETWSGGGCQRRCDGQRELLKDVPCICEDEDGDRKCKPTTRLSVMLPDVPGLGCWRLESHGWYAAVELAATANMLEQATARGQLLPARIRIDQRRQLKGGMTVRYAVPVLDLDITAREALALNPATNGHTSELATDGPTPVRRQLGPGVTVTEGLEAAASPTPRPAGPRSAEPIPRLSEPPAFGPPVPVIEDVESPVAPLGEDAITEPQKKKLNVLVGTLRDAGTITTGDVYQAAGRDFEIADVPDLHWSTLRETLSKREASELIELLEAFEQPVVEPVQEPLTIRQLNARIKMSGIEPALVGEIGRRLYPDADGAKSLSDEQRGAIWAEVAKEATSV